jgi:hypothetical protein
MWPRDATERASAPLWEGNIWHDSGIIWRDSGNIWRASVNIRDDSGNTQNDLRNIRPFKPPHGLIRRCALHLRFSRSNNNNKHASVVLHFCDLSCAADVEIDSHLFDTYAAYKQLLLYSNRIRIAKAIFEYNRYWNSSKYLNTLHYSYIGSNPTLGAE